MVLSIAVGVLLLVLWAYALRKRPLFGFGLSVGVLLAGILLATAPHYTLQTLPVWVPALPFALVATTLFVFAFLAWFWGTDR